MQRQAYDNGKTAQSTGHPCCSTLAVSPPAPIDWTALGNPFLLDAPLLISARISTVMQPAELDALVAKLRGKAARNLADLAKDWKRPGG